MFARWLSLPLWVSLCSGLVGGLGCNSDDKPTQALAVPLDAEELCVARLSLALNRADLCVAGDVMAADDWDPADVAHVCRPGSGPRVWAERLTHAVAEGRVVIDWQEAHTCLSESRRLRAEMSGLELLASGAWSELARGACQSFFRGQVDEGEACEDDWDCADATHGCVTETPEVSTSRACRPFASSGDACNEEYYPCAAGLFCSATNTCESPRGAGTECSGDGACASGLCLAGGTCAVPPIRALGDICAHVAECVGGREGCVACRAVTGAAEKTCAYRGGEGDACLTQQDCAYDLGCTDGVCTTVAEGESCGGETDSVCSTGLSCVTTVACGDFTTEDTCPTAHCRFTQENGFDECVTVSGECMVLPESGPCVGLGACGGATFCNYQNMMCEPRAPLGDPCVPFGAQGVPCIAGAACVENVCVPSCSSDVDCGANEACYTSGPGQTPFCIERMEDNCESMSQCGEGRYCYVPFDACTGKLSATTCEADAECLWDNAEGCFDYTGCAGFDEELCALFEDDCDFIEGACVNEFSCAEAYNNETACVSDSRCWYDVPDCIAVDGTVNTCRDQQGAGETLQGYCNVGQVLGVYTGYGTTDACASSLCYIDEFDGPAVCLTRTNYGCVGDDATREVLSLTFLFGFVRWARRRKERTPR